MDGVVEIITGRERRRRWSTTEKLRLVAEMQELDASVRAVAARHRVCEGLLFTWRRQVTEGVLVAPEMLRTTSFGCAQRLRPSSWHAGRRRPARPVQRRWWRT